jgi:hypothetical protein
LGRADFFSPSKGNIKAGIGMMINSVRPIKQSKTNLRTPAEFYRSATNKVFTFKLSEPKPLKPGGREGSKGNTTSIFQVVKTNVREIIFSCK